MRILAQYKNKSRKVQIQEKNTIHNSSKTISSASLSNNYFEIFNSIILICSLKSARFTLQRKFFLKDLLRHGKE